MIRRYLSGIAAGGALALTLAVAQPAAAQQPGQTWRFSVSGDSRNCGDVVMPVIAKTAIDNQAQFYWHLGDLRYSLDYDDDMKAQLALAKKPPMSILQYMQAEWPDFIEHQIKPFGSMPFYVGIGNHETVFPRTRFDFIQQFADWLVTPTLQAQRLKDDPNDHMIRPYFHWIQGGVAFYSLDNATADMFDRQQMSWFNRRLAKDVADPSVKTIVVGMHAALPGNLANYGMGDYPVGAETGEAVYKSLLDAQNTGKKHVYLLASHLHAYMANVYNSDYWRKNGGVLPGWIVGTAGAYRVAVPASAKGSASDIKTMTYGSLLATVSPDGTIQFEFKQVNEPDVPASVVSTYGKDFVHYCFVSNGDANSTDEK